MIRNYLSIEKSTEFTLTQNISDFEILTLNVQKNIIRLSAPFMQI